MNSLRYPLLFGITYLVMYFMAHRALTKTQIGAISVIIAIVVALTDLYNGVLTGVVNLVCQCPQVELESSNSGNSSNSRNSG